MLQTAVSFLHTLVMELPDLLLDQDIPEAVGSVMKKRKPTFKSMNAEAGRKADAKL